MCLSHFKVRGEGSHFPRLMKVHGRPRMGLEEESLRLMAGEQQWVFLGLPYALFSSGSTFHPFH